MNTDRHRLRSGEFIRNPGKQEGRGSGIYTEDSEEDESTEEEKKLDSRD